MAPIAMFVLLEHEEAPGTAAPRVHWDLLIELPGQARLATWRLAENPLATPRPIPAERIADHRRLYLDYEGEISGGRGRVRRLDRGAARVQELIGDALTVELEGAALRGRWSIQPGKKGPGTFLVLRPVAQ